jgi:hypothetical protein
MDAEDVLPDASLQLFDRLVMETSAKLKVL